MDEPRPLNEEIDRILDKVVTDPLLRKKVQYLREHADAVLEVRDRYCRVWEEMVGHEVGLMVMDGMSPKAAELATVNNLALRKKEIDDELTGELGRLQGELRRKLKRLAEDCEDERADQNGETPAS